MTKFHAVMLDETRCEFGVDVEAKSREEAYTLLREDYPESSCIQLESPEDTLERERQLYLSVQRELDGEPEHDEYCDCDDCLDGMDDDGFYEQENA